MATLAGTMAAAAKRAAYGASQLARIAWYSGHYAAGRRKMGAIAPSGPAPREGEFSRIDRARLAAAFRDLFTADWRNISEGVYKMPLDARRPPSFAKLMRLSRDYLLDTEEVARRQSAHGHSEVMNSALADKYPRYFLQNFHYQTDGWLSAASADRYEMQVETLFTGSAAAMRRQALPAIKAAIGARDPAGLKLIDLACGAGAFLETVKDNWPLLDTVALDLSPAYLGKARETLGNFKRVAFVEANAELTGQKEADFDIVTAIYLFHELPPAARRRAADEAARLLKPGGMFIQVDTIQYGDEPGLDALLERFPRAFHEPYYDSYCRTDLDRLFGDAGLCPATPARLAFLSKVKTYRKPPENS